MILNYKEYIKEYNQFHKYKTYDDWDEDDWNDIDVELRDYIEKVTNHLYGKYKKIDFSNKDIRDYVEDCMFNGKEAHMCAYLLTNIADKGGFKRNRIRDLKERPESQ